MINITSKNNALYITTKTSLMFYSSLFLISSFTVFNIFFFADLASLIIVYFCLLVLLFISNKKHITVNKHNVIIQTQRLFLKNEEIINVNDISHITMTFGKGEGTAKGGCASIFDKNNKQYVISYSDFGTSKSINDNKLIVEKINQFLNL